MEIFSKKWIKFKSPLNSEENFTQQYNSLRDGQPKRARNLKMLRLQLPHLSCGFDTFENTEVTDYPSQQETKSYFPVHYAGFIQSSAQL